MPEIFIHNNMHQFNSPLKVNKDKSASRFYSTSSKNMRLHLALDQAKYYSNQVNQHLLRSLQPNYVLKNAEEHYKTPVKSLSLTSGNFSSRNTHKKSTSSIADKDKNPQDRQLLPQFYSKTERISQLGQSLKIGVLEELQLRKKMKKLKQNITLQERKSDQIYINNCKMRNILSNAQTHIKQMMQQSRNRCINIKETRGQCENFDHAIFVMQMDNEKYRSKIKYQKKEVENCSKFVYELKQKLTEQVNNLNGLKHTQNIAYKSMINNFAMITNLKQQKALILNIIDQGARRNT